MNTTKFALGFPLLLVASCEQGVITPETDDLIDRDISGVAAPGDPNVYNPVAFAPRDTFGSANSARALGYPGLPPAGAALMNNDDPNSPLFFFTHLHTDEEGVGPQFNQRRCLGCHLNSDDIGANGLGANMTPSLPATLNTVSTPVSRAARQGVTRYDLTYDSYHPNTAAFTLFGDYFPSSGQFDPISILGGPLQHVASTSPDRCQSLVLPPLSIDPVLQGGIDPVTGLSPLGARREIGERAGPPYIGRGLMEAIYYKDLIALQDPSDERGSLSTLAPQPDPRVCPADLRDPSVSGDCISGRVNMNRADLSIQGGDPEQRVSRFGLRAAGSTMLQFIVGGLQGEIGLTNPFLPTEQNNVINAGKGCDLQPDPEVKSDLVFNLRAMIRLFAPPEYAPELRDPTLGTALAQDVREGARLFGIDMNAFRTRTTAGMAPSNLGDDDANHGIAKDRQLNCVGCHIPIIKTGRSPATIGAELLSNRWAPIFSDLLIHKLPSLPPGRLDLIEPALPKGLSRNLADYAIPLAVTGLASGDEFRTAPLMGLGKTGAPFLHDARVFINTTDHRIPVAEPGSFPSDRGTHPATPRQEMAETVYTNASGVNMPLLITNLDTALLAAVELHDLPAPPQNDYSKCPNVPPDRDICRRDSRFRGEARLTMEKWRALSAAQQLQVIKFLESL